MTGDPVTVPCPAIQGEMDLAASFTADEKTGVSIKGWGRVNRVDVRFSGGVTIDCGGVSDTSDVYVYRREGYTYAPHQTCQKTRALIAPTISEWVVSNIVAVELGRTVYEQFCYEQARQARDEVVALVGVLNRILTAVAMRAPLDTSTRSIAAAALDHRMGVDVWEHSDRESGVSWSIRPRGFRHPDGPGWREIRYSDRLGHTR